MTVFLPSSHDPYVVVASFALAMLASYVTLDLARRVRTAQRRVGLAWWAAGSIVMGTGIWSTHFLGMQAFKLPIAMGFAGGLTLLSWLAAVGASGVALELASRQAFGHRPLALGALAMGAGISGMHYIGMAALDMAPGIVWDYGIVALSVLIAVLASATALLIFQLLRRVQPHQRRAYQLAASLVMAVAICGMHYTGMAAASFAVGSVCMSAGELGGSGLTALVLMATGMLLVSTLFTSILDARLQSTAQQLTHSLKESNVRLQAANDELQQRAFTDALTGLPNRRLFEDRLI
jgi:NO-binding membrane sensor protein with MHYT domain